MLESLFSRDLWRPPSPHRFLHRSPESGIPEAGGAILVVPAQHARDRVDEINERIAALDWCIFIAGGDEESSFPVEAISHPSLVSYVQTPRPERHGFARRRLGVGWTPQARRLLWQCSGNAASRPLDWFFSGQVPDDHPARVELVEVLTAMLDAGSVGDLYPTVQFGQQFPVENGDADAANLAYLRRLASAKIAPAPAGPVTPDSFRCWEALEAACIPVVNARAPYAATEGYWSHLLDGDVPFPVVDSWGDFPDLSRALLAGWPANANHLFAWWQRYKRTLALWLDDDLSEVAGRPHPARPADRITILLPTSPIPSHPDTGIIEATVASIRAQLPLSDAELILMIDGVRPEQEHRRDAYEEYQRRLLWKANHEWRNVLPLRFEGHQHQAAMTRVALEHVRTPLVLFVEHDTPIVGQIDWKGLCRAIETGDADHIRLHHSTDIYPEHMHMMIDHDRQTVHGVPMLRTCQWSQRPHLASADFYRRILHEHFDLSERHMIEDRMHGVAGSAYKDSGLAGWNRFKLWVYAPAGSLERSMHLDGRAGDPKYVDH